MKYKVGDEIVIKKRLHGHEFKIGCIVKIKKRSDCDYYAMDLDGNTWWVADDEIDIYESDTSLSPDYRALYEQEKELREAAEDILKLKGLVHQNIGDVNPSYRPEYYETLINHYQQLKQQYNDR